MTGVQADRELDILAARRFTQERRGTAVCAVCGAVTRSMISDMLDHFEAANRASDEKAKSETGFRKFVANTDTYLNESDLVLHDENDAELNSAAGAARQQ